ncbi:MAG TPA: hypothetical protein VKZ74_03800 [Natronosporangium sp.]|nr:hypothetical protein [Natronosporangium sp.]
MTASLRRLAPYLFVGVVALATIAGLTTRPDSPGATPAAERVIVAGAVGLRWDDVDPDRTPNLWRLAAGGSIGALSVRSANSPTCAADGWLTLGAGNWAADRAGDRLHSGDSGPPGEYCPRLDVTVETESGKALLPHQETLVRYNRDLPWGAVPGALAGAVDCTRAFGMGAAVAAARSFGRVDYYRPSLPDDPERAAQTLAGECALGIVDLGVVAGEGASRIADVRRLDAAVARLLAARPPDTLLLVVGVADTDQDAHLHVAVADGGGLSAGWLTSATTGRTGYLQLVDVAPTVLAALDRPPPEVPLAGKPVTSRAGRPADLAEAVADLVAADQAAVRARPVADGFLAALTVFQLALFLVIVPLLRRREPVPTETGADPGWRRPRAALHRASPVLLVAAALAVPAALAAGAVPWWRAESAGGVFALTSLGVLAAAAAVVAGSPAFRHTLGLIAAAAGVSAAAVGADLLTGSWLQFNSVVGYSAHDGGRYVGLSEIGLGVLIASTLLVAGCLAEQVPRRHRPLVVVGVGALGVVLAGSPYLGDDMGGAVAMIVGVGLAAVLATGGWLTGRRVAWGVLAGLTVVVAVAISDLRQPVESRTGLGSLLTQFAEGTAGAGAQQVSQANAESLTGSPLTVLAIGAGAYLWFALLRPWGGLRRLFGIHPALRAGVIGATVASLVGGILIGAALTVAGAAAAVGVPLLTLAALRLRRSQRRAAARVDTAPEPAAHR